MKVTGHIVGEGRKRDDPTLPFLVESVEAFDKGDPVSMEKLKGSTIYAYVDSHSPTMTGKFELLTAIRYAGRDLEGLVLHGNYDASGEFQVYAIEIQEKQIAQHVVDNYHKDWIELEGKPNTDPKNLDPYEVIGYYKKLPINEKKSIDRTGPEYTKPRITLGSGGKTQA